jgi:transcriptional regulator with XRE-family HTH domain
MAICRLEDVSMGRSDVAADIGISPATLMRIEHGQAFDAETLLKLWTWLLKAENQK